jgi:hypothetical protein
LPRNETAAPGLPSLWILQGQSGARSGIVKDFASLSLSLRAKIP